MNQLARVVCVGAVTLALVRVSGASAQFPSSPPEPAPPRAVALPPFEETRLSNGLRVVLVENHELPIVSVSLTMPAGDRYDPARKEGLAGLTADLLLRGTTSRSADEIAAEIEGVGASLNSSAGADFFTVSTTVLQDHTGLAFQLLGDVLTNSTFPEEEVELTRTRTLSSIRASEAQPEFLADRFLAQTLYGDHPYGRTATSASVGAITRSDVIDFAEEHLRPDGSLLVVAGDITLAEVTALVESTMAGWSGSAPPANVTDPPAARPMEILLVNRPGSVQSEIRVGNLTMRPGNPDYYGASVANKILGVGFDSRLFLIVREEKGWTYDISSSQSRPVGMGRFLVSTPVRSEVTDSVLAEVFAQLRRLNTEPVTTEELQSATGFLVGSFPLRIETPQQIAGQVRNTILLGLGEDYLGTYRERIGSITQEDILDVAPRMIQTDSAVVVVVGDGQAIYDKLTAFGPVRIVDEDGNALTPDELTPEITAIAFDQSHIVNRADSFSVVVQGNPFGTLVRSVELVSEGGGESIVYKSNLDISGFVTQVTELVVDRGTMRPVKLDQAGQQQGETMAIHIVYGEDGSVTGTASVPLPDGRRDATVDTTLAMHVLDDNMIQALPGALPLTVGASFTVESYDGSQGQISRTKIDVSDGGVVTVPAGDFDTYKLDLTGGPVPLEYWVTKAAPRTLVKMVLVGQPLSFELTWSETR